ncbi:MAG: hypothetical protein EXR50_03100 [Dehalococcoidia bacterium]|nr:hypothetical protein [Dehalococcoidia bacterium]
MKENISVSFYEFRGLNEDLEALETAIIARLTPPINIDKNPNNPFRGILRRLRKECATVARIGSRTPIKIDNQSKRANATSRAGRTMGKYSDLRRELLPEIKRKLEKCDIPQQIQLERRTFDQLGNRQSYSFNIQYSVGQVINNLGGSAVARDLNGEIQSDFGIQAILKNGDFKINMDSSFIFWIRKF